MSSEVKTQVVWLRDGFGGGGHAKVVLATDYAALEAENTRLTEQVKLREAAIAAADQVTNQVISDLRTQLAEMKGGKGE